MKVIIVSAINFRNAGPLSILNDCLSYLNEELANDYRIIALVHAKELTKKYEKIESIPNTKNQ